MNSSTASSRLPQHSTEDRLFQLHSYLVAEDEAAHGSDQPEPKNFAFAPLTVPCLFAMLKPKVDDKRFYQARTFFNFTDADNFMQETSPGQHKAGKSEAQLQMQYAVAVMHASEHGRRTAETQQLLRHCSHQSLFHATIADAAKDVAPASATAAAAAPVSAFSTGGASSSPSSAESKTLASIVRTNADGTALGSVLDDAKAVLHKESERFDRPDLGDRVVLCASMRLSDAATPPLIPWRDKFSDYHLSKGPFYIDSKREKTCTYITGRHPVALVGLGSVHLAAIALGPSGHCGAKNDQLVLVIEVLNNSFALPTIQSEPTRMFDTATTGQSSIAQEFQDCFVQLPLCHMHQNVRCGKVLREQAHITSLFDHHANQHGGFSLAEVICETSFAITENGVVLGGGGGGGGGQQQQQQPSGTTHAAAHSIKGETTAVQNKGSFQQRLVCDHSFFWSVLSLKHKKVVATGVCRDPTQ